MLLEIIMYNLNVTLLYINAFQIIMNNQPKTSYSVNKENV